MELFLRRILPALIVAAGVGAGLWYRQPASAPPSVPMPATNVPNLAPSAPRALPPPIAPSADEASPAPAPEEAFDPCRAENAHDLWYRIASEYAPKLIARNYHFAATDGRTLLIRQQLVSEPKAFVQVTAQWYGRNDAAETLPKELLNETRFLAAEEVSEVAGPAWMERVTEGGRPLMTEEAFQLGSEEQNVTMRNGVAYSLKVKRNGKAVSCDKDEPCRCP